MTIIKISVLVCVSSFVATYKKEKESDFWQDLLNKLEENNITSNKMLHTNTGKSQHCFYIISDKDVGFLKNNINAILSSLITDDSSRKSIIVSASVPSDEELLKLKSSAALENPEFWLEADKIISENSVAVTSSSVKTDVPKPVSQNSDSNKTVEAKKEPKPKSTSGVSNNGTPNEKTSLSLVEEAAKIKKLKEYLLDRIKGQRHAVEEVVQGVFEAEVFASRNTERKGPLATFLFTGPSRVGKTYLATECGKFLGREMLVVDMSEYSDNLANGKFNGEYNHPAVVTGFVRNHPDGIIVFDEIEKAHLNTIHLFLQILDEARLMDMKLKKEVSFKDTIIIMTTNAGKALYDDITITDLSGVSRNAILEGLRKDVDPQSGDPFFPECITTRMANGHVILFNHLEPFALLEIVQKEIERQFGLFEDATGVKIDYDPTELGALMMYNGGGTSDARSLRGLAKNIIVREVQEVLMQLYNKSPEKIPLLKHITVNVDKGDEPETKYLFESHDKMYALCYTDTDIASFENVDAYNVEIETISNVDRFKKRIRGITDFVIIDPLCGAKDKERAPSDVEDIDSDGMRMFEYVREFSSEIPIYVLARDDTSSFDSLVSRGAKGIIRVDSSDAKLVENALETLSFCANINNTVYSLGRSGKFLDFNCAQYEVDSTRVIISFERLKLKSSAIIGENGVMTKKGANNNVTFKDVIGCKRAKDDLAEYCRFLDNPRVTLLSGKRMPKGALLYGPPGTGKTLLAKAMANECKAMFFQTTATSFFSPYTGQTEINIRELFAKARKYAPSIIFIDEVDAIGRKRTGSIGSTHNEDALNAFLAQMDGFTVDEKRPVFILAATNYDIEGDSGRTLDPAFVRRFDSKILIPLPDTDERYEFIQQYLEKRGIKFSKDHESIIRNMAERTGGMSKADLEMMHSNYVRVLGDKEPDGAQYLDSLDSYRFGEVNKMDPDHLRQTAYHEAGHALVCRFCGETPSYLTVVSRGGYGGYMSGSTDKKGTYTFDELMNLACRALAGRAAEIVVYGDSLGMNTGASSDIQHARYYVKTCLIDYAMGKNLSKRWCPDEAENLIRTQYERAIEIIREHRGTLDRLTDLLIDKKSLDKAGLEEFFKYENV